MTPDQEPHGALTEAHARLGAELRRIRKAAGKTTRQMSDFSSGHISSVENGKTAPSRRLVELYAELGGDRAQLIGALNALASSAAERRQERAERQRATGSPGDPSRQITLDSSYEDIRNCYRIEDLEYLIYFDANGVMDYYVATAKIRPIISVVRYVIFGSVYLADQRRGVLTVEGGGGCSVVKTRESDQGAVEAVAELDRPLVRTDAVTAGYSYRVAVNSQARAVPILREFARVARLRQAFRVQFMPPMMPMRMWWFRTNDLVDVSSDPVSEQLLPFDHNGFYYQEFLDLENEFVGLAWNWPSD